MLSTSRCGRAAATLALVGLLVAGSGNAQAAGSAVSGVLANFTVGGINTSVGPVNRLGSGGLGSTYDKTAKSGPYHRQLALSTEGDMQPILTIGASNIVSQVSGKFGVDTISEQGAAALYGFRLALVPKRAPGLAIIPFLQISAHGLHESGSFNRVVPNRNTISSASDIKELEISGSLVGNRTLRFDGPAAQNHILYQSPTVTITLNQVTSTDLISCGPKCVVTPFSVRTSVLNISLDQAAIGNRKITGEIVIGGADAGIEGIF
ncbi:MAG TPA: hypothetical protein VH722_04170 [Alphaproteobacteria bacterium]|nr:hypothetical protein [Alphaproteobacteria bacterium]